MEDHDINQRENMGASEVDQKKYAWKRRRNFLFVILLIIFVNILFILGFARYERYRGEESVEKTAQALRDWEKERYDAAMADTYGGKTPQETLSLYIDAVEKGDYELASKYFIESKRENELKSLQNATSENMKSSLELIKQSLMNEGSFSEDKKGFVILDPILVDFEQYPNGIWKIIEI